MDSYFDQQQLPTQYTARNIAVLVQTVVRGLVYLATFIFGANCAGLTGEAAHPASPARMPCWEAHAEEPVDNPFSLPS